MCPPPSASQLGDLGLELDDRALELEGEAWVERRALVRHERGALVGGLAAIALGGFLLHGIT